MVAGYGWNSEEGGQYFIRRTAEGLAKELPRTVVLTLVLTRSTGAKMEPRERGHLGLPCMPILNGQRTCIAYCIVTRSDAYCDA